MSRFVRRAPKRKTVWVGTASSASVAVASAASVIHSSFVPSALSMLAPTIVRVRGFFSIFPSVLTADLTWFGAYGLCIVSDEALAIGTTAIPRPHDDDDWPGWLVHGYFGGHVEADAAGPLLTQPTSFSVDSKAMRKVGVNESVVWMVEAQLGAVTAVLQARVLMLMS